MCIKLLIIFLLSMAVQCLGKASYDVKFESFSAIEGEIETLVDFRGVKLIGRERALNGSIFASIDLTHDILVSCEHFLLEYGMWIPSLYGIHGMSYCEFAKNLMIKYADFENFNTNFPKTAKGYCPQRKGEYWIINVLAKTDNWVSLMKRGLYLFRFQMLKNGKGCGGFEIVGNVVDRIFECILSTANT